MTDVDRYQHRHLDVICELSSSGTAVRTDEWVDLRAHVLRADRVPGGIRLWLPAELVETVRDLARRESACCGFLDLEVALETDVVRLDVTTAASAPSLLLDFLSSSDSSSSGDHVTRRKEHSDADPRVDQ